MPTCPATKTNGEPCTIDFGAFGSDGLCYFHSKDPGVVAHRQAGHTRGKQTSAARAAAPEVPPLDFPASPKNIEDAREYLAWIAHHALNGQLEPRQADAATKALLTWIKAEDYARQIRELRKMIADLQKTTKRA